MPRRLRIHSSGFVFHVLNRSARRLPLFETDADYAAFLKLLGDALARHPTRLLGYCVMPNHWHLVVWPRTNELSRFMHWLTLMHAQRWNFVHGLTGTGPVYQNRYKAIPVQTGTHLLTLLRYVERNPLRARLTETAEQWPWGSLWQRVSGSKVVPLTPWPMPMPSNWMARVNEPQTGSELHAVRNALARSYPFGDAEWSTETAIALGVGLRPRGRPRNSDRV
jgi:putative transposase